MSDRHRHDEFIWALIFSLSVNLLFVFAFLSQRDVANAPGLNPFFVSIAADRQVLSSQSHANPDPSASPAPEKIRKRKTLPPPFPAPGFSADPVPTQGQTTSRRERESEGDGNGAAPPPQAHAEASATAAMAKEISEDLSIWGDKMAGDQYTAPEYLGGEKPPYPKRAERNGWEGTVLLTLLINAKGAVEKVGIAKSSGYDLLDQQARASVSSWRFNPARRNGVAIAVTVQQPVIFRPAFPVGTP